MAVPILVSVLSALFPLESGVSGDDFTLKYRLTPATDSWGDQRNRSFINPILNSNYPDSDEEEFAGNGI